MPFSLAAVPGRCQTFDFPQTATFDRSNATSTAYVAIESTQAADGIRLALLLNAYPFLPSSLAKYT
jgi:hypothetical protein